MARPALLLAALLLAGCGASSERGAIRVSIVDEGTPATQEAIRGATGLGLLRLDEAGQLIEGMALRWAISEDGRDDIFRIDDARGLTSEQVARRLRTTLRLLGARPRGGTTAEAVTDAVVALRSDQPRPELAQLLAQPAQATIAPGRGPFRLASGAGGRQMLVPQLRAGDDPYDPVALRTERSGVAVARFLAGHADLVTGGTFATLPVARVAAPRAELLRFDEASGIFGLAVTARADPALTPAVVQALSLAIDRDRIVELLGAIGSARSTTADGSVVEQPLSQRQGQARATLAAAGVLPPVIRLHLPEGPGARLLFRLVQADWAVIGIATMPEPDERQADLVLIDRVVPRSERARAACMATARCDPSDPTALLAPPFIPIMTPLRWSLVAPGLKHFAINAMAAHPLDRLR